MLHVRSLYLNDQWDEYVVYRMERGTRQAIWEKCGVAGGELRPSAIGNPPARPARSPSVRPAWTPWRPTTRPALPRLPRRPPTSRRRPVLPSAANLRPRLPPAQEGTGGRRIGRLGPLRDEVARQAQGRCLIRRNRLTLGPAMLLPIIHRVAHDLVRRNRALHSRARRDAEPINRSGSARSWATRP